MKERPILFSAPMVRAILEGRKTQTRRVVKHRVSGPNKPNTIDFYDGKRWCGAIDARDLTGNALSLCPYGKPGDRLWVRETCLAKELSDDEAVEYAVQCGDPEYPQFGLDGVLYPADAHFRPIENTREASERWGKLSTYGGRRSAVVPAIHMPRWASRITLEIVDVRVQRLNDISERDCCAEGCGSPITRDCKKPKFQGLWESINGAGSWDANPWVWVIEFKRTTLS
jgi:hypothetical protein